MFLFAFGALMPDGISDKINSQTDKYGQVLAREMKERTAE